jgi:hypothetical protein
VRRFLTSGVQKHLRICLGKVHVKNFCQKKLRGKEKKNPVVFPPRFFLSRLLAVSVHEELKNAMNTFPKTRPENLKKSQNKVGR